RAYEPLRDGGGGGERGEGQPVAQVGPRRRQGGERRRHGSGDRRDQERARGRRERLAGGALDTLSRVQPQPEECIVNRNCGLPRSNELHSLCTAGRKRRTPCSVW